MGLEKKLKDINNFAPIIRSTRSIVNVDQGLNIGAFDLDRTVKMDPEFLSTDGEHEHDTTVSSVGVDVPGDVDLSMLEDFIGKLLREKAVDIYRMKGVLAIEGEKQKYQFHAGHMLFSGTFAEEWGEEPRCCRLTFIGKNLDHDELRQKFYDCMATVSSAALARPSGRWATLSSCSGSPLPVRSPRTRSSSTTGPCSSPLPTTTSSSVSPRPKEPVTLG